jgi:hypothetical protein
MIKPSPKTCNKEVQKFTNTSYDILLELYKNTDFFKELYAQVNPAYYLDFSYGLDGWQATAGTGSLTPDVDFGLSMGGNFYKDGLSIDAKNNQYFTLIFSTVNASNFVGDLIITYDDTTTVVYENVITQNSLVNSVSISLAEFLTHTGTITKINFVLSSNNADSFEIYKVVVGKPLVAIKSLSKLEADIIALDVRASLLESALINQESRIDVIEELARINIEPSSTEPEIPRYDLRTLSVNGLAKKIRFTDDAIELINSDESSYFIYNVADGKYEYKGTVVLNDGTEINSIDDIRAENGAYNEFRFKAGITAPEVNPADPLPEGWTTGVPTSVNPIWMITAVKKNNALISPWSTPIKISAKDGQDGSSGQTIAVFLTNESFNAPSNATGTEYNLFGSGGTLMIYSGNTQITEGIFFSGSATKDGLTLNIDPITGAYSLSGSNWSSDSTFFDLSVEYNSAVYTKRYSISKNKSGTGGQAGAGFFSANIASNIQTGSTLQTTLNAQLSTLAGRGPTQGDSLFITWLNGSQGYTYVSGSWGPSTLSIDGSVIASGTIAGDKLVANALYGKRLLVSTAGQPNNYVYIVDPSGVELPDNMLVWYGLTTFTVAQRTKANGIFWLDKQGNYSKDIQKTYGFFGYRINTTPTYGVTLPNMKGLVEIQVKGKIITYATGAAGDLSSDANVEITLLRNGSPVGITGNTIKLPLTKRVAPFGGVTVGGTPYPNIIESESFSLDGFISNGLLGNFDETVTYSMSIVTNNAGGQTTTDTATGDLLLLVEEVRS